MTQVFPHPSMSGFRILATWLGTLWSLFQCAHQSHWDQSGGHIEKVSSTSGSGYMLGTLRPHCERNPQVLSKSTHWSPWWILFKCDQQVSARYLLNTLLKISQCICWLSTPLSPVDGHLHGAIDLLGVYVSISNDDGIMIQWWCEVAQECYDIAQESQQMSWVEGVSKRDDTKQGHQELMTLVQ